ncbi:hypothetical protein D3OALGA1CA_5645 [Olavius algarvensis associated proteobacterium Delta 3]|nr:hypothetical protein D3OALGB2SA_4421 [Olavius algarvensis associated proteobacterium Delta 3]CAB5169469.1 hypothetical protein D3OALGA1CA_5645 [Olavius algarvensis associated proteobacterium Delta 3]
MRYLEHTRRCVVVYLVCLATVVVPFTALAQDLSEEQKELQQAVAVSEGIGDSVFKEASRVSRELQMGARSLFTRDPLGWDIDTIDFLTNWLFSLPLKIPAFLSSIQEQSRLLGAAGSLFVFILLLAVLYSLLWQGRVLTVLEERFKVLNTWLPQATYPYYLALLRIVVASLVPLLLLGGFSLVRAFIPSRMPWFLFIERLLILWTIGAVLLHFLGELLLRDLFRVSRKYGRTLYNISRVVVLYILLAVGVIWAAETFHMRQDVQAFIRFIISLSIVCALIPLLLKKQALLSLLPELPYRAYQNFINALERYYFPVIFFTFLTGLMWCVGYQRLATTLWTKTWAVAGSFVLIMIGYHVLSGLLNLWVEKKGVEDEEAKFLYDALRALLRYITGLATVLVALHLLGFLRPLQGVLSLPIVTIGETPLSVWILGKALIILIAILYVTRLLQAYLTYKIYPPLGIESGLAYVLNTFLKYTGLVLGLLFSLAAVGIDFRIFMVFAGAVGIGLGLGMQAIAANLISGFSLIFGRKLRKDDWIQVGETRGVVTDIFLRATKVRTRDNIEYLIPNSDFISKTFVNYTLSTPMIRIHIPVRVGFDSDPSTVSRVLVETAEKHPEVEIYREPEVSFVGYGDNSLHFELLVWIDIRDIAAWRIRSRLYFGIFKAFRREGIRVPLPQRDLHLRTAPDWMKPGQ